MAMPSTTNVFLVSILLLNLLIATTSQEEQFCVPKPGTNDQALQANIDYACGSTGVDCEPIQPGGDCFEPNDLKAHAAFAMHAYYNANGRNDHDCDFAQTGTFTNQNPSTDKCVFQ